MQIPRSTVWTLTAHRVIPYQALTIFQASSIGWREGPILRSMMISRVVFEPRPIIQRVSVSALAAAEEQSGLRISP